MIKGWVMRIWIPSSTDPRRGRPMILAGAAEGKQRALTGIMQAIEQVKRRIKSKIDPAHDCAWTLNQEPSQQYVQDLLAHIEAGGVVLAFRGVHGLVTLDEGPEN